jgi:hypothetical protein
MQEQPGPGGREEETEFIELGEPAGLSGVSEESASIEEVPDLDERERRIAEERKPMGPPLEQPQPGVEEESAPAGPGEGPTDPE